MAVAAPAALAFGLTTMASGQAPAKPFQDAAANTPAGDFNTAANWDRAVPAGSGAPCQLDDGASTNALGLTNGGVTGWVQRYDSTCSNTIENIATTYGWADSADAGVSAGDPVGYAILEDTGSGPGAVIFQDQGTVEGASINTNTFQPLPVDPPQSVSGSFYLAVWVEHGAGTFPAPMDEDSAPSNAEDVYFIYTVGGTFGGFDPGNPGTSTTMAAIGFPTAWMLRGNEGGELPPGACCLDGAACPEDLTGDGEVGGADLGTLLSAWGPCDDPNDCPEDLTGDGEVGGADLGTLLSAWGPCDEGGGGCQIVDDEAACNDLGGQWAGSGTNCDDHCPIEGACCDGENCSITSPDECDAIGGTYQGNFTECDPNPCLQEGCGTPGTGDCCVANGTPYCEDEACCDLICGQDPFCCDTEWDQLCADQAVDQCEVCGGGGGGGECGDPNAGDCCIANGTPFCEDEACCDLICGQDPFCCDTEWDQLCADAANADCEVCQPEPLSNCCEPEPGQQGCEDAECEAAVCDVDSFCCDIEWDSGCASLAEDLCGELCQEPTPDCVGSDASCDAEFILDNCITNNALGLTNGGVIGWAQRYDASNATINNIATTYGWGDSADAGLEDCQPVGWAILEDSGSGPGAVIAQGTGEASVDAMNSNESQIFETDGVDVDGSFYVAIWVEHGAGTFPAPMDDETTPADDDDVFLIYTVGGTFDDFDPANPGSATNMADIGFPSVWWLRANQ